MPGDTQLRGDETTYQHLTHDIMEYYKPQCYIPPTVWSKPSYEARQRSRKARQSLKRAQFYVESLRLKQASVESTKNESFSVAEVNLPRHKKKKVTTERRKKFSRKNVNVELNIAEFRSRSELKKQRKWLLKKAEQEHSNKLLQAIRERAEAAYADHRIALAEAARLRKLETERVRLARLTRPTVTRKFTGATLRVHPPPKKTVVRIYPKCSNCYVELRSDIRDHWKSVHKDLYNQTMSDSSLSYY